MCRGSKKYNCADVINVRMRKPKMLTYLCTPVDNTTMCMKRFQPLQKWDQSMNKIQFEMESIDIVMFHNERLKQNHK